MPHARLHPSELFDLEILLPVHPVGHWLDRIHAFRRFGLLPAPSLRVRLVLLCGTYALDPALCDPAAWTGVSDLVVINGSSDETAAKIYDYYANVLPEEGLRARWYLRLHDDSLTDIRRLVNHLDFTFHWRDLLHLTGHPVAQAHPAYVSTLRELGGERILQGIGSGFVFHEREHCLSSHETMRRVLAHRLARELLRRAALIPNGDGDHCLSYAARIAGVPLAPIPFLSDEGRLDEFAAFAPDGRGFFHIHGLSPDRPEAWARAMKTRRDLGLSFDVPCEAQAPADDSGGAPWPAHLKSLHRAPTARSFSFQASASADEVRPVPGQAAHLFSLTEAASPGQG